MLADLEATFNRHDDTIRRAEANAQLAAALKPDDTRRPDDRPARRVVTVLRRIAGTPAFA
jgi:hypothetical protein